MTEGEADDGSKKPLGANPNDEEGEGEEDEETTYSCRVKVYKFTQKEGQPHWAEFGVGE
jgi:nucleoporin NUP2